MKKSKLVIFGLSLLALAMVCNVCWAIQDYGIKDMKNLSSTMLAQASDSSTGDGTTGDGTPGGDDDGGTNGGDSTHNGFEVEQSPCIYEIQGKVNGYVTFGMMKVKCDGNGIATFTYDKAQTLCSWDGKYAFCKQITCGEFYISMGSPSIEE